MRFFAFLRTIIPTLRLAWRLVREPRVPFLTKLVPLLALFYVVDPLDIVPDVLPIVGELDDLFVIAITIQLFVWLCPKSIAAFHRKAIGERRPYAPMRPEDVIIDV